MVLDGFRWFSECLEGFERVWEGLGWVGRGGEGWGGCLAPYNPPNPVK